MPWLKRTKILISYCFPMPVMGMAVTETTSCAGAGITLCVIYYMQGHPKNIKSKLKLIQEISVWSFECYLLSKAFNFLAVSVTARPPLPVLHRADGMLLPTRSTVVITWSRRIRTCRRGPIWDTAEINFAWFLYCRLCITGPGCSDHQTFWCFAGTDPETLWHMPVISWQDL